MNPEQAQGQNTELSPDDVKALLGFSTHLNEQFMGHQAMAQQQEQPQQEAPTAPVAPEMAPQSEIQPKAEQTPPEPMDLEPLKKDLVKELSSVIKDSVKEEMGSIRKEIEKAISDEDKKTETK